MGFFNPPGLTKPRGHSHVAVVTGGKTIYIAGQVALNSAGELVGRGDFRDETFSIGVVQQAAYDVPTSFSICARSPSTRTR